MSLGRWCVVAISLAVVTNLALRADNPPPNPEERTAKQDAAEIEPGPAPEIANRPVSAVAQRLEHDHALREREAEIHKALDTPVTVSFNDRSLNEAVRELAEAADIAVWIDRAALAGEGIATDEPVTIDVREAPLRRVLRRILTPLKLTAIVDGDVVRITTHIVAVEQLTTRVYDVAALLSPGRRDAKDSTAEITSRDGLQFVKIPRLRSADAVGTAGGGREWLVSLIQRMIAEPWEEVDGAGGTAHIAGTLLVVRHTPEVHDRVASLLTGLKSFVAGESDRQIIPMSADGSGTEDAAIVRKLKTTISVEFEDRTLKEALTELALRAGVPLHIDTSELTKEGIAVDDPVTAQFGPVSAYTAFSLISREMGLQTLVRDGTVWITTTIAAEDLHEWFLYDVRDLLAAGLTFGEIEDTITAATGGPWEDMDGTGGRVAMVPAGGLAILQQAPVHSEIALLLADMRRQFLTRDGKAPEVARPRSPAADAIVHGFYPQKPGRAEAVLNAILAFVLPESWEGPDAVGLARVVDGTIVVRHTVDAHRKIQTFLEELERAEVTRERPPALGFPAGGGISGGFFNAAP